MTGCIRNTSRQGSPSYFPRVSSFARSHLINAFRIYIYLYLRQIANPSLMDRVRGNFAVCLSEPCARQPVEGREDYRFVLILVKKVICKPTHSRTDLPLWPSMCNRGIIVTRRYRCASAGNSCLRCRENILASPFLRFKKLPRKKGREGGGNGVRGTGKDGREKVREQ